MSINRLSIEYLLCMFEIRSMNILHYMVRNTVIRCSDGNILHANYTNYKYFTLRGVLLCTLHYLVCNIFPSLVRQALTLSQLVRTRRVLRAFVTQSRQTPYSAPCRQN